MILHKYQALGNDFLILDCISYKENSEVKGTKNFTDLITQKSDRRRIGCDQFIVMEKSKIADCKIIFYNADGSRAESCGNGTVASAVYTSKLLGKNRIRIETDGGVSLTDVHENEATIELKKPETLRFNSEDTIRKLMNRGVEFVENVSVGNPHCVVLLNDIASNVSTNKEYKSYFENLGRTIENMVDIFPNRTNVEFVIKTDENTFDVFVWERGAGRTFACGTGACAVAFACAKNDFASSKDEIKITMAGSFHYANHATMKVKLGMDSVFFTNSAFFEGKISC